MIENKDCNGQLLREADKKIRQYINSWHKKNSRLNSLEEDRGLLEKIAVAWIRFFNTPTLFEKRRDEANQYLLLIQNAMNDIPAEFYKGLKELLEKSNWGPLAGSNLHKMMKEYKTVIDSKPVYRPLVNPTAELLEEFRKNEKRHQQELQLQGLRYQQEIDALIAKNKAQEKQYEEQEKINQTFRMEMFARNKELQDKNEALEEKMELTQKKANEKIEDLSKRLDELVANLINNPASKDSFFSSESTNTVKK